MLIKILKELLGFFKELLGCIPKAINYLLKNDNKAIRYTSAGCLCLAMVILCYGIIKSPGFVQAGKYLGDLIASIGKAGKSAGVATEAVGDAVAKGAKLVADGAQEISDLHSLRKKDTKEMEDKLANYNPESGEVEGNVSKIIVANMEAKEKLESLIQTHDSEILEKKLTGLTNELIRKRKSEADQLFQTSLERVPTFVKNHYEDRSNEIVFKKAMENELFTSDMLDTFIYNTALEMDRVLFDAINSELDGLLRYMEASMPNLTHEELKKRLPDTRMIIDSIYAKLNNKGHTTEQVAEVGRYAERLVQKYDNPAINGAVTFITGSLLTYGVVALIPGVGQVGILIGVATTLFATYEVTRDTVILNQRYHEFEKELNYSLLETCEQFKVALEKSMKDILENYKKADFFKDAVIEVNPAYQIPSIIVDIEPTTNK